MPQYRLHCSLITPEAKVFEDDVDFVAIPAHDGEIGILFNRSPLVCQLGAGQMKVRTDHTEQTWFIDAGFAQVVDNRVTILTQKAIKPEQINRDEANRQLEDARLMPTTTDDALRKRARAEASARAKVHLAK
jgi:F-type H+-transporting ATPase subunit epsilon